MVMPYVWYLGNVVDRLSPDERIGEDEFDMLPLYRDSPRMRIKYAWVYNLFKLTNNKISKLLSKPEKGNLKDSTIILLYADNDE